MGRLLNAYSALGIPGGTPLTVALRRYRWLAQAFHPDRFVDARRPAAEREMKLINDARDTLRAHFSMKHKTASEQCDCEGWTNSKSPSPAASAQQAAGRTRTRPSNEFRSSGQILVKTDHVVYPIIDNDRLSNDRKYRTDGDDPSHGCEHQHASTDGAGSAAARCFHVPERTQKAALQTASTKNAQAIPQWVLVMLALFFLSMAMYANHQNSGTIIYNSDRAQH